MDAIEKRARELAMAEIPDLAKECFGYQGMTVVNLHVVMRILRAALTPPEGHVVVIRNEAGKAVAVTRQDHEGRNLSVIAEFGPPDGYVLVPVEPTEDMLQAGYPRNERIDDTFDRIGAWADMLAARPEVKP
ncbi:TPA: hypothetical protein ACOEPM_000307 [Stenotrophomonas maltophilia]